MIELDDIKPFVNEMTTGINATLPAHWKPFSPIVASGPQWFRLTRKDFHRSKHFMFIERNTGEAFKAKSANHPSKERVGNFLTDRKALLDVAITLGRAGMSHVTVASVGEPHGTHG